MSAPEIECPDCDGWGRIETGEMERTPAGIGFEAADCAACNGTGWRPMMDDEQDAAAEQQFEDFLSEPPMSLDEQHARAWAQKQELRR